MNVPINYLAVLLAGVVSMIVGFVWYGPLLGKVWMKEKGITAESMKKNQKSMGMLYGLSFVGSLVMAYMLSHVMFLSMNFLHYPQLMTGLTTAFSMWFGFVMPVQVSATIFGTQNWKLFAIDTGYQLASLLGMGLVVGILG